MLQPMAKMASMYRPSKEVGVFSNRYCIEMYKTKKKCKKYAYKKVNSCNNEDWQAVKSARYVLVPITEL
jgi:hypothetical protein